MAILDIQSAYDHLAQKIKDYINKYTVKTVNGIAPDSKGNVKISIPSGGSGSTVSLTPKITQGVNIADVTINGTTTKLYSPDFKNKTAVVFGDSLFNNPTVGYEFGDWLEAQGVYKTVYNHAYEGSGFGNTYQYRSGYSLYELLTTTSGKTPDGKTSYADIQNHVREADVIYIHLGGNDIISQGGKLAPMKLESNVYNKVKNSLDKIRTLNPNAIIYYTPFSRLKDFVMSKSFLIPNVVDEGQSFVNAVTRAYDIMAAVSDTLANVVVNDVDGSGFGYEKHDELHPTKECAELFFDRVLHGRYISKYLRDFLFVSANNVIDEVNMNRCLEHVTNNTYNPEDVWMALVAVENNATFVNAIRNEANTDPYKIKFVIDMGGYMGVENTITRMIFGVSMRNELIQEGYIIQAQKV